MLVLSNERLSVKLDGFGAAIAAVRVRLKDGRWLDVALSPAQYDDNDPEPAKAGRTIGPCCGRIREGAIEIEGKKYQLTRNEGQNHIHGGPEGCAFKRWREESVSETHARYTLELPDGQDGYPGNRCFQADYILDGDALRVTYTADTDAPTFVDMTNHVYWDLSGRFDGAAMDQYLEIAAGKNLRNDGQHLPEAIVDAAGAFDFSHPRRLSAQIAACPGDDQLQLGRGYNNAFVLNPGRDFSARLHSDLTGVTMTLTTDQPAIVLYTGGFLNAKTRLSTAPGAATPGCAVALEAQGLPDPFHLPGIAPEILKPGDTWQRTIEWRFSL